MRWWRVAEAASSSGWWPQPADLGLRQASRAEKGTGRPASQRPARGCGSQRLQRLCGFGIALGACAQACKATLAEQSCGRTRDPPRPAASSCTGQRSARRFKSQESKMRSNYTQAQPTQRTPRQPAHSVCLFFFFLFFSLSFLFGCALYAAQTVDSRGIPLDAVSRSRWQEQQRLGLALSN